MFEDGLQGGGGGEKRKEKINILKKAEVTE